ncbi:MAG: restriction endonuclease subunit S [Steroidobacteraceae bacterium]
MSTQRNSITPQARRLQDQSQVRDAVMIDGLTPYPAMKDSGVPWLGRVPAHWQVSPAFAVFRPRQVKNAGMVESAVLSLSYGKIIVKAPEKLRGLVPESFETYQIVEPGNIIVRTTDLQNDRTSLRVGHARDRGIITSAYMCLETRPLVLNEFGYQYLNAYDLLKIIYGFGSGLRQNLDFGDIKRMPVLVPPEGEQAAIVRFLERADTRIRRYIRAKQKLIKLLEEQKQAIIHRAVTCGLDPNVRLKPSGVEWLGDVPEHWEVVPARYLFRAVARRDLRGDEVKLSVTQRHGLLPTDEMKENSTQASSLDRFQVCEPGDLVLNKYKAHLGVFWAARVRGLITPNYTVFKPGRNVVSRYFELLFHTRSYRDSFSMTVYGVTEGMSPLYTKDFYSIPTAFPPQPEQARIVEWIDERTMHEGAALDRIKKEIDLLREYRTRLIADVVTGKLDVREAAAKLPPETDEPESRDEPDADGDTEDGADNDADAVAEEAEA